MTSSFHWADRGEIHNCYLDSPVSIKTRHHDGTLRTFRTSDMGFIVVVGHGPYRTFEANVFGTINADTPRKSFDNIDDAKAYVEQQALVGIVLNKLTR